MRTASRCGDTQSAEDVVEHTLDRLAIQPLEGVHDGAKRREFPIGCRSCCSCHASISSRSRTAEAGTKRTLKDAAESFFPSAVAVVKGVARNLVEILCVKVDSAGCAIHLFPQAHQQSLPSTV